MFRSFATCLNRELGKLMRKCKEERASMLTRTMSDQDKAVAENLFLVLTMTTRETSLLQVTKVEENNGFQASRALVGKYEPKNAVRHVAMLKKLMAPEFGSTVEEFSSKPEKRELAVSRYEQSSSQRLGDDKNRATAMAHAPLQNNNGNYMDYDGMKVRTEEWTRTSGCGLKEKQLKKECSR